MKLLLQWNAAVQKQTKGRIRLRFQRPPTWTTSANLVRQMNLGRYQGAMMTGLGVSLIQPEVRVLELPFLIKTDGELDYVRRRLGFVFRRGWRSVATAPRLDGPRVVYGFGKTPLRTSADFRRGRFFVWTTIRWAAPPSRPSGCTIVPLGIRDVMPALTTGRIDWVYGTPMDVVVIGWNRRLKNMNDFAFCPGRGPWSCRRRPWTSSRPKTERCAANRAGAGSEALRQVRADNVTALAELRKGGSRSSGPPPPQTELEPLAQKVWRQLEGRLFSREILQHVKQALADYRRGKR